MMRDRLNKLASRLPLWKRIHNRMMMSVSAQIADIIDAKFNSRREFAESLGKKESEVSKWLSGTHNFTLKSLAKIEEKLEVQFIHTSNELNNKLSPYEIDKSDYFKTYLRTLINQTVIINKQKNDSGNKYYFVNFNANLNLWSNVPSQISSGFTPLQKNNFIVSKNSNQPSSLSVSAEGYLTEEYS